MEWMKGEKTEDGVKRAQQHHHQHPHPPPCPISASPLFQKVVTWLFIREWERQKIGLKHSPRTHVNSQFFYSSNPAKKETNWTRSDFCGSLLSFPFFSSSSPAHVTPTYLCYIKTSSPLSNPIQSNPVLIIFIFLSIHLSTSPSYPIFFPLQTPQLHVLGWWWWRWSQSLYGRRWIGPAVILVPWLLLGNVRIYLELSNIQKKLEFYTLSFHSSAFIPYLQNFPFLGTRDSSSWFVVIVTVTLLSLSSCSSQVKPAKTA